MCTQISLHDCAGSLPSHIYPQDLGRGCEPAVRHVVIPGVVPVVESEVKWGVK